MTVDDKDPLPDVEELFETFFARWYSDQARARRTFKGTRPDLESGIAPGQQARNVSPLTPQGQEAVLKQIAKVVEAAKGDLAQYLQVSGEPDLEWIDAFDRFFDIHRIKELVRQSNPENYGNAYVVTCCEFGALIGDVFTRLRPGFEWLPDWPYWESGILDCAYGVRINVFHWAIKKLSPYGVADGFRAKMLAVLNASNNGWKV